MQTFQFGKVQIQYAEFFGIFKIYKEDTFIDPRELNDEQIDSLLLPYLYPAYFPFEEFKRFMEFYKGKEANTHIVNKTEVGLSGYPTEKFFVGLKTANKDNPDDAQKGTERAADRARLLSSIENAETDRMGFKDLNYVKIKEHPNGHWIVFEVLGGCLQYAFLTQKEMLDFILARWW